MNLLDESWIQVLRSAGEPRRIRPAEIVSSAVGATDIFAPRPDFRAALYQFLIGLRQTGYAPEDWAEWRERWDRSKATAKWRRCATRCVWAQNLETDYLAPRGRGTL